MCFMAKPELWPETENRTELTKANSIHWFLLQSQTDINHEPDITDSKKASHMVNSLVWFLHQGQINYGHTISVM